MKIKRRVPQLNEDGRAIPGKFLITTEEVTLVRKSAFGATVRLANGDEIYRKNVDIVQEEAL